MADRTIIIAGASGFLGRNLCAAAVTQGYRVVGINRSGVPVPGCIQTVALTDLAAIGDLPADAALFHAAAARYNAARFQAMQVETLSANARITEQLYAFCAERGIGEVRMASSSAVYPSTAVLMDDAEPLDLNAPPHQGEALYAWSKRWGEIVAGLYADRFGIATISFRLSNPYGPFDTTDAAAAHVAPAFVIKALSDDPVFELRGNPDAQRDFIFAGDVADIFLRSLSWRGCNDAFNLCTGEVTDMRTLAGAALRAVGSDKPIVVTGEASGVAVRRLTAERLRAAFGITDFTTLDAGMKLTADWYRDALVG